MSSSGLKLTDKVIYCINGGAIGDIIAAAPSVKWAIDNFHKTTEYRVAVEDSFREIFHFVPSDKIVRVNDEHDKSFAIRKLNMDGGKGNVARLTPSRVKLTQYASIGLLGRVLSDSELKYVPFPEVDLSKFNVDFSKTAVFITTYRDPARAWNGEEIIKTAKYVESKGFTPVFVGRTGKFDGWNISADTDFKYPGFGIDLLNKTSVTEMANVMRKSRVVFGMDSGALHVAFTTETPIIAGFTKVSPNLRVPYRGKAITIPIVPDLSCRFCQSDWQLDFWNFSKCPRGLKEPECATIMKADYFIKGFDRLDLKV